jgi:phosphoglycerol transferase MdoB-like AlkP superfamily enzyme
MQIIVTIVNKKNKILKMIINNSLNIIAGGTRCALSGQDCGEVKVIYPSRRSISIVLLFLTLSFVLSFILYKKKILKINLKILISTWIILLIICGLIINSQKKIDTEGYYDVKKAAEHCAEVDRYRRPGDPACEY